MPLTLKSYTDGLNKTKRTERNVITSLLKKKSVRFILDFLLKRKIKVSFPNFAVTLEVG